MGSGAAPLGVPATGLSVEDARPARVRSRGARHFQVDHGHPRARDRLLAGLLVGMLADRELLSLEGAEDQLDGSVDFSGLCCVEAACEVSEAAGLDGSHLVD